MAMERPGQVVRITNPSHKYYGEEAVIQMTTPKTYHIRLLNKKRPFIDRFIFSRGPSGRVNGTKSDQISMTVRKPTVTAIPGRTAAPKLNTWQNYTSALLDKYLDKTKEEILRMQK
jgi:hypothetical protein